MVLSGVLILVCLAAFVLAFANGANDNAKGVATLVGGQVMPLERAVRFAAGATFLGSLTAVWWAQELADKFSGKGLVDASLVG